MTSCLKSNCEKVFSGESQDSQNLTKRFANYEIDMNDNAVP